MCVLSVKSACADKGTGKKQDIKITGASTLAGDEVDRMVKDAEQYADEDKKRREAVDVKNQVRCQQVALLVILRCPSRIAGVGAVMPDLPYICVCSIRVCCLCQ